MTTLPRWRRARGTEADPTIHGFTCDDFDALRFGVGCALFGFDLPNFDEWLAKLDSCGARDELLARRALAHCAMRSNDASAVRRHLEWMLLRRDSIDREDVLLPLAKTGDRVRKPFRKANQKRKTTAATKHESWQQQAALLWNLPQHAGKTAADIARLIDPRRWNTIRRHIRKP